jgi:hypothetical protein
MQIMSYGYVPPGMKQYLTPLIIVGSIVGAGLLLWVILLLHSVAQSGACHLYPQTIWAADSAIPLQVEVWSTHPLPVLHFQTITQSMHYIPQDNCHP